MEMGARMQSASRDVDESLLLGIRQRIAADIKKSSITMHGSCVFYFGFNILFKRILNDLGTSSNSH